MSLKIETMNLKLKESRGQDAIGFVDIYELDYDKNATCIVNYLPMFDESYCHVYVTVLLEGERREWTKGEISEILNGLCEDVELNEEKKFETGKKLSYVNYQLIYIDKIENFDSIHGDFSYRELNFSKK